MKLRAGSKAEEPAHPAPGTEDPTAPHSGAPSPAIPAFRHILVAIDFSETAAHTLDYALALAQNFHSQLTMLHVVEPPVSSPNPLLAPSAAEEAHENLLAGGRDRLKKLKQRASSQGVSAETLVRMGRAQSDIADTARALGADLIVLGTHGSMVKQSLLGGTAERVLRQAACPVLTVPPSLV
jgi:nucleotide-binding universal stress UspA family protein